MRYDIFTGLATLFPALLFTVLILASFYFNIDTSEQGPLEIAQVVLLFLSLL